MHTDLYHIIHTMLAEFLVSIAIMHEEFLARIAPTKTLFLTPYLCDPFEAVGGEGSMVELGELSCFDALYPEAPMISPAKFLVCIAMEQGTILYLYCN